MWIGLCIWCCWFYVWLFDDQCYVFVWLWCDLVVQVVGWNVEGVWFQFYVYGGIGIGVIVDCVVGLCCVGYGGIFFVFGGWWLCICVSICCDGKCKCQVMVWGYYVYGYFIVGFQCYYRELGVNGIGIVLQFFMELGSVLFVVIVFGRY